MGTDQSLADRKPETGAAGQARQAIVHAVEAVEDALPFHFRYAGSIIPDAKYKLVILLTYLHGDLRLRAAILDRVLDQVA